MKQFFYFILLLAGFSSVYSCKDLTDEDGNPLIDLNNSEGLTGQRALYREITDQDTLAEYHYSGLLMTKVLTDSASVTDVMYSGNEVSKVVFNGFLDGDGDGDLDTDSISYTQLFTYGSTGKLESISENRSFYRRGTPVPPATLGPQALLGKSKTLYNLTYNSSTNKLQKIVMKNGPEVSGNPFAYTDYSETMYTYLGDNVSKVERNYGPISSGGVFGTATNKLKYEYLSYDTRISPFTLLPYEYKVARLLSTNINDYESFILSPNSPARVSVTDMTIPIPSPVIFTTNYNYDPQTYMIKGFGINYIYKPL